MTREGRTWDAYTGRGGQMAVLAKLLLRRINVAVPEIDEGEDVLAFVVHEPEVTRIQVKTAVAELLKEEGRYAARVSVPLEQLRRSGLIDLYYVFAIRLGDKWRDFIIISREELHHQNQVHGVGYVNRTSRELQLYLSFTPQTVLCSGQDWRRYREGWQVLPAFLRRLKPETE
jgi:hypothetical protein